MMMMMRNSQALFIALFVFLIAFDHQQSLFVVEAKFWDSTYFNWGAHHSSISNNGDDLQLVLDKTAGSGIETKKAFLFGSIEMLIKLVPGNSAGTVTAYYLSSTGNKHDEIDFEFLGNVSGKPYIIHTNVYAQGIGNREQQFYPWFDPTADFHNYTIHWNPTQIVWFIDGIPIRVFRNYENMGIQFPNKQGMKTYCSLWNADNWATRGGLDKIDWKSSPFTARFRRFTTRACIWNGPGSISQCASKSLANWWNSPVYSKLNFAQIGQMKWVREKYMIYDYCKDFKRFHWQMPRIKNKFVTGSCCFNCQACGPDEGVQGQLMINDSYKDASTFNRQMLPSVLNKNHLLIHCYVAKTVWTYFLAIV